MLDFRKFKSGFVLICISISFLACNFTTTTVKNPMFAKDSKSLSRDVNSIILTQEIDINGVEVVTNGKSKSELTIGLLNAKNIPTDSSIRNRMIEHIATIVKHALIDTGEYMYYEVLFVNRTINDGVTKTTSTGKKLKSEEIKPNFYLVTLGDRLDTLPVVAAGKSIFSKLDSDVVSSLSYYDHRTNLTGQLKMYKQTDTDVILITTRNLGRLELGYRYYTYKFKVSDFYNIPQLGSGEYRIEYIIGDSSVGTKAFKLL